MLKLSFPLYITPLEKKKKYLGYYSTLNDKNIKQQQQQQSIHLLLLSLPRWPLLHQEIGRSPSTTADLPLSLMWQW